MPSPFSFDDYDNVIGFVVSQAGYRLSQALIRAIESLGSDLRPREFAVLNRLHERGELTQIQLAELTYKDKPAITRMLDRLIDRGLVRKTAKPVPDDPAVTVPKREFEEQEFVIDVSLARNPNATAEDKRMAVGNQKDKITALWVKIGH